MINHQNEKIHVFHRRISTDGQNLDMQVAADKQYREQLHEDEFVEINEIGISANKVKLQHREKMSELITWIKQGKIDTLYVYDRSRLTRNFYEYMELADIFNEYGVKVEFTTTDSAYPPYSHQAIIEGVNGMIVEEEGKAIARRITDVRRKLPSHKFGYEVDKEDNQKRYTVKEDVQHLIQSLFDEATHVLNHESFIHLLSKYNKLLKKKPSEILKILVDPFYTGHEQVGNHKNRLSYVEPMISWSQFNQVYQQIAPFVSLFTATMLSKMNEDLHHPFCGVCKNEMRYFKSHYGETGRYKCTKCKGNKIEILVDEFNECLIDMMLAILHSMRAEELSTKAIQILKNRRKRLITERDATSSKIDAKEFELALLPFCSVKQSLGELELLRKSRQRLNAEITECELQWQSINVIIDNVKMFEHLVKEDAARIMHLFIKKVYVHYKSLDVEIYFNNYFDKEKLEGMLNNEYFESSPK